MAKKTDKKLNAAAKRKQELEKFKKTHINDVTTQHYHHNNQSSIPRVYVTILRDKQGNQAYGMAIMAELDHQFYSEMLALPAEATALPGKIITDNFQYLDTILDRSFQMAHGPSKPLEYVNITILSG